MELELKEQFWRLLFFSSWFQLKSIDGRRKRDIIVWTGFGARDCKSADLGLILGHDKEFELKICCMVVRNHMNRDSTCAI